MPHWRTILAYSLLAVFLLAVALWVRSFAYQDQIRHHGNWIVRSSQGVIEVQILTYHETSLYRLRDLHAGWEWKPYVARELRFDRSHHRLGFGFSSGTTNAFPSHVAWTRISFPHWCVAIVAGLLFVWARPKPKFRFSMGEFALAVTGFTLLLGFAS